MKRILFFCFIVPSLFCFKTIHAQYCGASGSGVCTPDTSSTPGFESMDSIPCIIQGIAYSEPIKFRMFNTFNVTGLGTVIVDSIEFLGVDNLPCGLCWAADKASKRYAAGVNGCLNISGTTNDTAGQYKLAITLHAWFKFNGNPGNNTVPPNVVDQSGIKMFLRVQASSGGSCIAVDTSSNAHNLDASCITTGIHEIVKNISEVQIMPNPIYSNGVLMFKADKNAACTVKVSDMTGKIVSIKEMEAKAGINTCTVERNNLPVGIYFVSISDGQTLVTVKFAITE